MSKTQKNDNENTQYLTDIQGDEIILFPGTYNEIKLSENETDIVIPNSPELWKLISRYACIEDIEKQLDKPIEQVAYEAYKAKYLPDKELKIASTKYQTQRFAKKADKMLKKCCTEEKYKEIKSSMTKKQYNTTCKKLGAIFIKRVNDDNKSVQDVWRDVILNAIEKNILP